MKKMPCNLEGNGYLLEHFLSLKHKSESCNFPADVSVKHLATQPEGVTPISLKIIGSAGV